MDKYLSKADLVVIIITFVLFIVALFVKGFTNALLLEAGVLLVSVKIIMLSHKSHIYNEKILKEIEELKKSLHRK